MNILVCGFMGSGKTTFVEGFSENSLGFSVHDLDHEVAKSIPLAPDYLGSWIHTHGMSEFRKLEKQALQTLLMNRMKKIIALGGGTIEVEGFDEFRSQSKIVFLDTPFETCYARIKNDINRPLSSMKKEDLKELYNQRMPAYRKADLILSESDIKEIDGLDSLVHNLGSV